MTAKKVIGVSALICGALVTGGLLSRHPWDVYRSQQQQVRQKHREMQEIEQRREDLLREEAEVRSSVGRERLARKAGFVNPGEVPDE